MRFLVGDPHDRSVLEKVGVHDVVRCGRLRSITRKHLILATMTIPEVPGFP